MKLNYESGQIPTKYELLVGELAYNVVNNLFYTRLIDDSIILVGGDRAVRWDDVYTEELVLDTSPVLVATITPSLKIKPDDSLYSIKAVLDNNTNQERDATFTIYVNGVAGNSQVYVMPKDSEGKLVIIEGVVPQDYPAGTEFSLYVSGDNISMRGDLRATQFTIKKFFDDILVVG